MSSGSGYILGLNAYHPDSSACLLKDGMLVAAAEEERFVRIKHWAGLPVEAIRSCLQCAGIGLQDVEAVALNRSPGANVAKKCLYVLKKRPRVSFVADRLCNALRIQSVHTELASVFNVQAAPLARRMHYIEHHRAHLASAYFASPFEEAAVVSVDGFGDFTSCMVAAGSGNGLRCLYEINYPHSLGIFYTACTQLLGFKKFGDEYKVMGLAAYGVARYTEQLEKVVQKLPRGRFRLAEEYFALSGKNGGMQWRNTEPSLADLFSDAFARLCPCRRDARDKLTQEHMDFAASAQAVYESVFFHILKEAARLTRSTRLCLAGGCAMNSVANGKIFRQSPFTEVFVQPASSDAGGALGAALFVHRAHAPSARRFVMEHAAWGPQYGAEALEAALRRRGGELAGCSILRLESDDALCAQVARLIADGNVVGWFQGRMEWGARALGNRSILADPRRPEMRQILNERIKRREEFRPFAPAVLLEEVGEYFEESHPDPFMLKVYPVRPQKQAVIPAVTHVDGSGRLQTVERTSHPLFWKLIRAFADLTGVAVLLNTSFNENEPIVCTPDEALDCFVRTKMDCLVLGRIVVGRGR